jgi:hypothetical protein
MNILDQNHCPVGHVIVKKKEQLQTKFLAGVVDTSALSLRIEMKFAEY